MSLERQSKQIPSRSKAHCLPTHPSNLLNFLSPMKGEVGKESFQLSPLTPTSNLLTEERRVVRNGLDLLIFYWITITRDYGRF